MVTCQEPILEHRSRAENRLTLFRDPARPAAAAVAVLQDPDTVAWERRMLRLMSGLIAGAFFAAGLLTFLAAVFAGAAFLAGTVFFAGAVFLAAVATGLAALVGAAFFTGNSAGLVAGT